MAVRWLGILRVAAGAAFLLAPRRAASVWTGTTGGDALALVVRGFGGRDVVLGLGTLWALARDRETAPWLLAGAAADATDALGMLTSGSPSPARRFAFFTTAAGAAVVGVRLARAPSLTRSGG